MNKDKNISNLIHKHINNKISKEELNSLHVILNTNTNSKFEESLFELWESPTKYSNNISEKELSEIFNSVKPNSRINIIKILSKLAALFFLPLLLFTICLMVNNKQKHIENFTYLETPMGSKQKIILPDSSIIWQNSGSKIKYSSNYGLKNRTIHLTGEAFFDVKTNKKNPFYVITKDGKITVTGTKFNINTYREQKYTQIGLESGILSFKNKFDNKIYILQPGEILHCENHKVKKGTKKIEEIIAWKDGLLIFDNETLAIVAKKLNRWYDSNIIIDKKLLKHRITITIGKETLEKTLSYIKEIIPIKIEKRENKKFIITKL